MATLITDPLDLLLDADGDLDLSSGDLALVSGLAGVVQLVSTALRTFKGEWFANLDHGVPYFDELLGQKFNEANALNIFRAAILSVAEITSIVSLSVDFNSATRAMTVEWRAISAFGDTDTQTEQL